MTPKTKGHDLTEVKIVRFFPKNRFRVITPNQSLHSPRPPTSPASNSFLSQLLAVTIPSLSPRKPVIPEKRDESWEVPGQEGEVSLVASSVASRDDEEMQEPHEEFDQQEELEPEPWTGTPEQHCSPLSLNAYGNVSAAQEHEQPSVDWQVPEDMSNLLSQRFSPPSELDSFSISEPARPHSQPPAITDQLDEEEYQEKSMAPEISIQDVEDSNPTIRRGLSPSQAGLNDEEPETPTPANRPFTSIFADMSAEQADLSWPLIRATAGEELKPESRNILAELEDNRLSGSNHGVSQQSSEDTTQFFDCTVTSLSLSLPSPLTPSTVLSRSVPAALDLYGPSKSLFDAHSAHTNALASELALYRALAEKLHIEVSERDGVMADLNLRILEGEIWRVRVDELEAQLKTRVSGQVRHTPDMSPLEVSQNQWRRIGVDGEADRTTRDQAETRDLEIRLAKALADQEVLGRDLAEERDEKERNAVLLAATQTAIILAEQRERDAQVRDEGNKVQMHMAEETHAELNRARQLELELRIQLDEAMRRTTELEVQVDELKEVNVTHEEETARLVAGMEKLRIGRKREEEWRSQVEDLEIEIEVERTLRSEADHRAGEERDVAQCLESNNREVSWLSQVRILSSLNKED